MKGFLGFIVSAILVIVCLFITAVAFSVLAGALGFGWGVGLELAQSAMG